MFCLHFQFSDIRQILKKNNFNKICTHVELNMFTSVSFLTKQKSVFLLQLRRDNVHLFSHCTQTKIGDILFNIQFCLHIILPRRKTRKSKKKSKRKIASGFTDNNTVWLTVGRQLDFLRTASQESMMLKFPFSCLCHPSLITKSW